MAFFRTMQLNVTCDNSFDREDFLHYSLIPSVSKGSTAQEGWGTEPGAARGEGQGGREEIWDAPPHSLWAGLHHTGERADDSSSRTPTQFLTVHNQAHMQKKAFWVLETEI